MEIKQYQIVLVNLEPTLGSEMKKIRPSVVVSPNEMNQYLQTVIIAPITSTSKPYPSRVKVTHHRTSGWIVIDQIRTIDRQRIIKVLDHLTDKEIKSTKAILKEILVD